MSPDTPTVRRIPAPYSLETAPASQFLVLPDTLEDESGVYSNDALTLVKELRNQGIDAAYLHSAKQRRWLTRLGDVPVDLAIGFASGLLSAAAWDGLKCWFADRLRGQRVRVKIARIAEHPDGRRTWSWYDFEGEGADVADALERVATDDDSSD